jgi:NADH-quinone oxidoreductase subunit M
MWGKLELEGSEQVDFADVEWNEKLAAVILILGILVIGVAPFLLQQLINPASQEISNHILRAAF